MRHSVTVVLGGWETSAIAEMEVGFGCTVSMDVFCDWTVVRLVIEASCEWRKGRVRSGSKRRSVDTHQPAFADDMILEFVKKYFLLLLVEGFNSFAVFLSLSRKVMYLLGTEKRNALVGSVNSYMSWCNESQNVAKVAVH